MPAWILWGLLISGGSAVYWWKKANPGKTLNPMPPADDRVAQNTKP